VDVGHYTEARTLFLWSVAEAALQPGNRVPRDAESSGGPEITEHQGWRRRPVIPLAFLARTLARK
jgi:hypothetical protein